MSSRAEAPMKYYDPGPSLMERVFWFLAVSAIVIVWPGIGLTIGYSRAGLRTVGTAYKRSVRMILDSRNFRFQR